MKYIMLFLLLAAPPMAGCAETIFVYVEECCNGVHGIVLSEIKEGIFDALFEAGHIVFDDVQDKGTGSYIQTKNFAIPLAVARQGGAKYMLAVGIRSTVEKISKTEERISSTAEVYLLLTRTNTVIYFGKIELSNKGKEDTVTRDTLGFNLGTGIAALINPLWQ
jgi:hypothetical protein